MHGLVLVDRRAQVLRPAIIWCDSRAVDIGERAFRQIGPERCLRRLLNSPGNFTASKLRWVKENEPRIFAQADKALLPGDYIAMRLTGEALTTPSGLSEGILFDYEEQDLARIVLEHYGIPEGLIPPRVPCFAVQGEITAEAARALGVRPGTPVAYRAGDQPNNAFSLRVLDPGEVAATAGTSGVVYGVGDQAGFDPASRVNTFVHVNHHPGSPRYGTLLCVNGTGILYRWLKNLLLSDAPAGAAPGTDLYETMNGLAGQAPAGAQGLRVLPYGNGAERTLENRNIGAAFVGLDFNLHDRRHILRAAQEGIVFALSHGLKIMEEMGIRVRTVRAGNTNMFRSALFGRIFATVTGARVELFDTDGSQGAARGAGIGAGIYPDAAAAFRGLKAIRTIEPDPGERPAYLDAYQAWGRALEGLTR
jgi:xylulokinase